MSQTSASPFITHSGVAQGANLTVPDTTSAPSESTKETYEQLRYQLELLVRQNKRLKDTLSCERKRLKNERKRGDDLFAKSIHLEAEVRCLRDSYYALHSEIMEVEEFMEMRRKAERDRRRRIVGHGGVPGTCCPYSGRRARQMGASDSEDDGEWDEDCFSCCPCCRFSNCETACGTNCRIEGHFGNGDGHGDDSGSESGTATPPSRPSSGGERNLNDVDFVGDDSWGDPANAEYVYEGDGEPGFGLGRDLEDAGVEEHARDADERPGGWTDDVGFRLGVDGSYDGDEIKMDAIHLETEDDDGYDGGAEMTDVDDGHMEQEVAEFAPSPASFAEEVTSQIPTDYETKRQLLMEIVNKLGNFDEEGFKKSTSQDQQQILLLDGTGKCVEHKSAPQDEDHSWKTSAAKGFLDSKYLKRQNSQMTFWDLGDKKGDTQGMKVGQGHIGLKGFYELSDFSH